MNERQGIASLFNLIVYREEEEDSEIFNNIIKIIIRKFPCKIIFIIANLKESKDSIECEPKKIKLEDNDSGIECEEVNIKVSGKAIERVPFLILSHLASDLPIYLLWGQDPAKSHPVFSSIEKISTHLIIDSGHTDNLQKFSRKMLDWKDCSDYWVIDMNWVRFSGWRHVLLQAYDTSERIEELRTSDRIVIKYNRCHNERCRKQEVQAIYLQAWLATQLEWNILSNETKRFTYNYNGNPVVIELEPVEKNKFSPGSIFEFASYKNDKQTILTRKIDSPGAVSAEISSKDICQLPFTIPLFSMTRGLSFVKELLHTPTSDHYYRMLKVLTQKTD